MMKNFNQILVLILPCFLHVVYAETIIGYWEGAAIGLGALIVLILDFIAIFEILTCSSGMFTKLCWILFIFFFPVIGLIVYCLCARHSMKHGNYVQV